MKSLFQPKTEFSCDKCKTRAVVDGLSDFCPDGWIEFGWKAPHKTRIGTRHFDSGTWHLCPECKISVLESVGIRNYKP